VENRLLGTTGRLLQVFVYLLVSCSSLCRRFLRTYSWDKFANSQQETERLINFFIFHRSSSSTCDWLVCLLTSCDLYAYSYSKLVDLEFWIVKLSRPHFEHFWPSIVQSRKSVIASSRELWVLRNKKLTIVLSFPGRRSVSHFSHLL
jgi:hypothetical protein